jgi:hypothetical protein
LLSVLFGGIHKISQPNLSGIQITRKCPKLEWYGFQAMVCLSNDWSSFGLIEFFGPDFEWPFDQTRFGRTELFWSDIKMSTAIQFPEVIVLLFGFSDVQITSHDQGWGTLA